MERHQNRYNSVLLITLLKYYFLKYVFIRKKTNKRTPQLVDVGCAAFIASMLVALVRLKRMSRNTTISEPFDFAFFPTKDTRVSRVCN